MLKGEPEEAVRVIETAYRLDPIRPNLIGVVGNAYFLTGREQDALEHWKKNEQLAPAEACRSMTDYYLNKGDIAKAWETLAKYEKLRPTAPWVTYMGGFIAATEGDRDRAMAAIRKIEEAKMGPLGFNFIAYVYLELEDLDRFFEYMNRALETHAIITSEVMYSPLLARARTDPRYQELVEKLRK